LSGGVFVRVAEGVRLEKPIHLLFVNTGGAAGQGGMVCPRALIVAADRADFSVVESFAGPEGGAYFTNAVTEIAAGEDCRIDHNTLNADSRSACHVATMEATIGALTTFIDHSRTIGGCSARTVPHTPPPR